MEQETHQPFNKRLQRAKYVWIRPNINGADVGWNLIIENEEKVDASSVHIAGSESAYQVITPVPASDTKLYETLDDAKKAAEQFVIKNKNLVDTADEIASTQ